MNKIKVKTKMGITNFEIKSQKGQQLNEHEAYSINSNVVSGLLHLEVLPKGATFTLLYNVTGFVTLKDFLARPLTKVTFTKLLENILAILKSMKAAYFHENFLIMDFDKVMVNPNTQSLFFIYVPIPGYETGSDLRQFLLDIVRYGSFMPGESTDYIQDYIGILNKGINFSVFELEEYVKRLSGKESSVKEYIECSVCHTKLEVGTSYCTSCGNKIAGNTGEITKNRTYNPIDGDDDPIKQIGITTEEDVVSPNNFGSGTTVLGDNLVNNGTIVLGSDQLNKPVYPYLIREKNNEKIVINKPSFRVGKEKSYCDYFVADNAAVSRSHADIITREGRYYIKDLNSTNRTFLDGRPIQVEVEVELYSGTKIRLANEDFTFFIEE